jgi:hypothetical protein
MALDTPAQANDTYRASLRSTYVDGVDDTFEVTAVPLNVPTIITIGWQTEFETVFRVEGKSGDSAANYALTGLTKLKGYTGNLAEGLAVNCLNHEEYFNQWGDQIEEIQEIAEDAAKAALTINTVASSATPSPVITTDRNLYTITALAVGAELAAPTGTPANGMTLIVRIKDNGTARALTYNAIYNAVGVELPSTTVLGKTLYLGFVYNSASSEWDCILANQEE